MPRVVSLFLPFWPTDRIRKHARSRTGAPCAGPPEAPLVTVSRDGARRVVVAVDATALALGLRPGQPVAQAQASVPGLVVADATPETDARALGDLAGWCLRYAPVVQADPPDGIFIDITGAAHLFGGERALLDDLTGRLNATGLAAVAGLADTPGAAHAAARFGIDPVVPLPGGSVGASSAAIIPPGGHVVALAPWPITALRLPPDAAAALRRLGIARIAELARLPRAQLTLRIGPETVALYDQALGQAAEPLTPLVQADRPHARLAPSEPLGNLAALEAVVSHLAGILCGRLEQAQLGLRQLDCVFRRVDGCPLGFRIGTAIPTRDPAHCVRLVLHRLPEIDPGFGIDEILLVASRSEPLGAHQMTGLDLTPDDDGAALGPLIDRLGVRLGPQRVFRAAPLESEYPERSVRRVAALAPPSGGSWPARLPRPSRLVDPPEIVQATALAPDNPPAFFVWRRRRFIVRHADGPERIYGEWWVSDAETQTQRDYYRVEDRNGRRFWLFRDAAMQEGGRWWLHGFFS